MRRLLLTTIPLAGLALAGLAPFAPAQAQMISSREGIALENQILKLRQQMQAMQQGGGNGGSALGAPAPQAPGESGGASAALLPNMLQQVQTLTDEVQSLRGRVDTLEHEVATQHDQLNQELGDLKYQMGQNGQGGGQGGPTGQNGAPSPGQPGGGTLGTMPASPEHPAAARPELRPEASLTAARRALDARQYQAAEADARAVIAHQGKNAGGGAAELTLGDALSRQGKHQEAAIAYDDAYNANRRGKQAPDALLGLANSLTALHQNQAACATLGSLTGQSSSAGLASRVRLARQRAHCG
ncbi:MAG: tetratricopeptide repeat protein [Acidiphilium sp.]